MLSQTNTVTLEGNGTFSANVIRPLTIGNECEVLDLGKFRPCEVKYYTSGTSAYFDISGEPNYEVTLKIKLDYTRSKIKLLEMFIQNITASTTERVTFYNQSDYYLYRNYTLDSEGKLRTRIQPYKVKADWDVERGKRYYLTVTVSGEYRGI